MWAPHCCPAVSGPTVTCSTYTTLLSPKYIVWLKSPTRRPAAATPCAAPSAPGPPRATHLKGAPSPSSIVNSTRRMLPHPASRVCRPRPRLTATRSHCKLPPPTPPPSKRAPSRSSCARSSHSHRCVLSTATLAVEAGTMNSTRFASAGLACCTVNRNCQLRAAAAYSCRARACSHATPLCHSMSTMHW